MNAKLRKDQLAKVIRYADDLYPVMQNILMRENKIRRAIEHFWVASLDVKRRLLNVELVNIGGVRHVNIEPPEIFRIAIYKAAVSVVLVHNHPSGMLEPSGEDFNFTDRLIKVGKLLNIKVVDHLIITETDYLSMEEQGIMERLKKSGLYEITLKESEDMKAWREEALKRKAKEENSRAIAMRMLERGIAVEDIVLFTKLRKSSVEKMRREMGG